MLNHNFLTCAKAEIWAVTVCIVANGDRFGLVANVSVRFCLHLCECTNHNNLNFLSYQLIYRSHYFRFQILVSIPSIINPNMEH